MHAASFALMRHAEPGAEPAPDVIYHLRKSELFRDYQRAFEIATGQPLALRRPESFRPPMHGSRRLNPFCEMMRARSQSCAACLRFQQQLDTAALQAPATLECFAGMTASAFPLRLGERLVGYVQTGQVFLQPPAPRGFAAALREAGLARADPSTRKLEGAYFQTPVVPKAQYEARLGLVAIFARHLTELGHALSVRMAAAELPAITKIRAFVAEHQNEQLHLHDAAHAVNLSPFYFCKLFKRATGITFTRYLAGVRVETAKRMLVNVNTRISEAAYAAGFQSLSQFNRLFRRIAGEPPSRFRKRLQHDA